MRSICKIVDRPDQIHTVFKSNISIMNLGRNRQRHSRNQRHHSNDASAHNLLLAQVFTTQAV
jgi:hypothetical protein